MLLHAPGQLDDLTVPVATAWLLGACMEARGKQDLWPRRKPEVLARLREQAMVQSVESSNRIEGVVVSTERLRPLVLGKARPRDRSEEEVAGYRAALDWIYRQKKLPDISPELILRLHATCQGVSSGNAGQWKKRDNEIIEISPDGRKRIRFVPTPATMTATAVETICQRYAHGLGAATVPPLILLADFIFDFLCIHPFRDGNGRVSRLLTTLLLESQGFRIARFVSIERLVEQSREEYYTVLERCSAQWHEGRNEVVPWWNYLLGLIRRAYQEMEHNLDAISSTQTRSDQLREIILAQRHAFTLSDIQKTMRDASPQLIRKVLALLKNEGLIRLSGWGRGARWEVVE